MLLIKNMEERPKRKQHVGVLIKCTSTGRLFMLQRGSAPHKGSWGLISGGVEEGEDPLEALKREVNEELSIDPNIIQYRLAWKEKTTSTGVEFFYYVGFTNKEFIAKLDHENLDYKWASIDELPSPLFPNLDLKIAAI